MKNMYDYEHVVPIPSGAHVCKDLRIYLVLEKKYFPDLKYNMDNRIWIGKKSSEGYMYPSREYRERYPETYKTAAPELFLPEAYKKVGLYGVVLSIGVHSGLYSILIESFGLEKSNLIMDYAVSMMRNQSNVVTTLETEMKNRVIFLNRPYSDAWIGEKLNEISSGQRKHFFDTWLKACAANGINSAWICVDGCNSDYAVTDSEMGEKGKAKSGKNRNIIGYMYVVADDGTPIYGKTYRGGRVDSKEFTEIIDILREYAIKVKGIILDRGFCDIECFRLLDSFKYTYVIMLKENTIAYKHMIQNYANMLKLQWEYALGNGYYGTTEQTKVFRKYENLCNVALIWDSKNGIDRVDTLIEKATNALEEIRAHLSDEKKPSVPHDLSEFITIEPVTQLPDDKNPDGTVQTEPAAVSDKTVTVNDTANTSEGSHASVKEKIEDAAARASKVDADDHHPDEKEQQKADDSKKQAVRWQIHVHQEALQTALDAKGYYALASSDMEMTAKEMDDTYNIRDKSEKQNSRVKTQLGSHSFRGHTDNNNDSRFVVSFAGSCVRNEFEKACRKLKLDVNKAIRELDHLALQLGLRDEYHFVHNESGAQLSLLKELQLSVTDLDYIAGSENARILSGEKVTKHTLPESTKDGEKSPDTKRVDGIPHGSKAKGKGSRKGQSPIPDEKHESTDPQSSKDKNSGLEEAAPTRRGRGRPKGSKNKPKDESLKSAPKRPRGRPKGSKNKPKDESNESVPKRPRGRPKGSKNKSKGSDSHGLQKSE